MVRHAYVIAVALTASVAVGMLPRAAATTTARSVTFAGPIRELQADAGRAIVLVAAGRAGSDLGEQCADVAVWAASSGTTARLVDHVRAGCHVADAPYNGFFGVALAGRTAGWAETSGGHILATTVYRSTLAGARSVLAREEAVEELGGGQFLGSLRGDGRLLAYNSFSVCQRIMMQDDTACPPEYPDLSITAETIELAVPAERVVARSAHELTVLAVGGGRIVARTAAGPVLVLAPRVAKAPRTTRGGVSAERIIASYAYPPSSVLAAVTDGRTLVVLRKATLDVIPLPGSPGARRTLALPTAVSYGGDRALGTDEWSQRFPPPQQLRLVDVDGSVAVYVLRDTVNLVDLRTGRRVGLSQRGASPVSAQLEPDGLYVGAGRVLTFTPRAQVDALVRR